MTRVVVSSVHLGLPDGFALFQRLRSGHHIPTQDRKAQLKEGEILAL